MSLKTEGEIAEILASIREAYGQLETEYELQRAMLHEKAAENAKLHGELKALRGLFEQHKATLCDANAENAKLRDACELLVSWADYGGDAVAMLDDAVDAARKALGDAGV